jgi:hypothetical protein
MDLPGFGSVPATTRVYTFPCHTSPASDNQEWRLVSIYWQSPEYLIINVKSGLCLDVSGWASDGSDRANDTPLTVFGCSNRAWANGGYDDHVWSFY